MKIIVYYNIEHLKFPSAAKLDEHMETMTEYIKEKLLEPGDKVIVLPIYKGETHIDTLPDIPKFSGVAYPVNT